VNVEIIVLVGSFLTGISGMVVALYTAFSSASRGELEAVVKENNRLREIMREQDQKIDHLESEVDRLRRWAERLVRQVTQLGGEPAKYED